MTFCLLPWIRKLFLYRVYSLMKEFAPNGANSFLKELTLVDKGGKRAEVLLSKVYSLNLNRDRNIVLTYVDAYTSRPPSVYCLCGRRSPG